MGNVSLACEVCAGRVRSLPVKLSPEAAFCSGAGMFLGDAVGTHFSGSRVCVCI